MSEYQSATAVEKVDPVEKEIDNDIGFSEKPVYDFFKRVADLLIGFLCLFIGLPFYAVICLVIMIEDFGNPIFVQKRVGQNGRIFKMYKFRTMCVGADSMKVDLEKRNEYNEVHFKMSNDPRVTRVGKFLRRTSIDEIPQCLNLILGNMTIIGPRPFIQSEQVQMPNDRLVVKPGLSCYWQITDTTKMSIDEQLELDYKYIRERSILTDLKLIGKTVGVVFRGKNK